MKKQRIRKRLSELFKKSSRLSSQKATETVADVPVTEPFERCVLCGALTSVPVETHVDFREDYEIGCGQLCAECARKQWEASQQADALSVTEILQAVERSIKESRK